MIRITSKVLRRALLLAIAVVCAGFATDAEAQYAAPSHRYNYSNYGITRVQLEGLDNSSTAPDAAGYTYYQNQSAFLVPGNTYSLSVSRGSYYGMDFKAWIDFNGDQVFDEPSERIFLQDTTSYSSANPLTYTKQFTVPMNAVEGITRMRVRSERYAYSTAWSPTQQNYYGDSEDYDIILGLPLGVDDSTPLSGFAGLEFSDYIPLTGGAAPFSFQVEDVENAGWVKFDPTTGKLFGTPDASLAGGQSRFRVTVQDATQTVVQKVITVQFRTPLSLQYSDPMDGSRIDEYAILNGFKSQASIVANAGVGGSGLVLSSNTDGAWPLETTTSPPTLIVLNTPAHWDGGSSPDASAYHGSATFVVDVTNLRRMNLEFDYNIVNQATDPGKEFFAQFVVEYAEASGTPAWQSVGGDSPPVTPFYRASNGFEKETVSIPLSGNNTSLGVRIRWLVRNKHDGAAPTYVAIDNLRAYVPPQITNSPQLPSIRATEPYPTQSLVITGGLAPYTVEVAPTNPILSGLNLEVVQDTISDAWQLKAKNGKGPAEGVLGVQDFDLILTDAIGTKFQDTYSLTVTPAPPLLKMETLTIPSTARGVMYETDINMSGGLTPYLYELSLNAPAWISISTVDIDTARISANIDASIPFGDYTFTVIVDDLINSRVSRQFTLSVVEDLSIDPSAPPAAEEGRTYQHFLSAVGGSPTYSWAVSGGNKPAGIKLNSSTGELFGVPYAGQVGQKTFTVQVSDSGVQVAEQEFTIDIAAPSTNVLQVETSSTQLGTIRANEELSSPIFAFGGVPPYVYTATNTTGLPAGVELTEDGRLEGTPISGTEGSYLLRVKVQDAGSASITVNVSYLVEAAYQMPTIATTTINQQQNINDPGTPRKVGDTFIVLLKVDGGVPPYSWSVAPGSVLPDGLVLDELAGSISGTLRPASLAQTPVGFNLIVEDGLGNTHQTTIGGQILPGEYPALFVSETQTLPVGLAGGGHYSASIAYEGGVGPYRWQLIGGSLPFGLVIAQNGTIHGNIPANQVGNYLFTVRVTDDFETSTEATLSMSVVLDGSQVDIPEGPPADGLSNLGAASGSAGGCSINGGSSSLWLLVFLTMGFVALSRRKRA